MVGKLMGTDEVDGVPREDAVNSVYYHLARLHGLELFIPLFACFV